MTLTNAPTLRSKRLIIRGPQKSDLPAYTAFMTTSPRMKNLWGNTSEGEAWRGFIAGIGHWQWHGYGFFIVADHDNQPLGRMGILHHADWPEPELAYHVFDHGEGHGYAYEAGVMVRHWAHQAHDLGPLMSMIHPDNARSIALAERLGATREAEITHVGDPAIIFRHLAANSADAQAQYAQVAA